MRKSANRAAGSRRIGWDGASGRDGFAVGLADAILLPRVLHARRLRAAEHARPDDAVAIARDADALRGVDVDFVVAAGDDHHRARAAQPQRVAAAENRDL